MPRPGSVTGMQALVTVVIQHYRDGFLLTLQRKSICENTPWYQALRAHAERYHWTLHVV